MLAHDVGSGGCPGVGADNNTVTELDGHDRGLYSQRVDMAGGRTPRLTSPFLRCMMSTLLMFMASVGTCGVEAGYKMSLDDRW